MFFMSSDVKLHVNTDRLLRVEHEVHLGIASAVLWFAFTLINKSFSHYYVVVWTRITLIILIKYSKLLQYML